jgi:tRNA-dihydrouridine synthase B
VKIPVLANGDVDNPEKAKQVLAATGADFLMVGRAAQGRPWIFREIEHFLATGKHLAAPAPDEVCEIMLGHLDNLYSFYGEFTGVRIARKHISWYLKTLPGSAGLRERVLRAEAAAEQQAFVRGFFADQDIRELAA